MQIAANVDYYAVLGVTQRATPDEIRYAYRALARKYHPDLHPGDQSAEQNFRAIQEAYEVLSDPYKRKAFDYYGSAFGERIPSGNGGPVAHRTAPRPCVSPDFIYRAPLSTQTDDFSARAGSARDFVLGNYRWLGHFTVAAVILIGTFAFFLWPDPSIREFKDAQEALRHVRSWKSQSVSWASNSQNEEQLDEVACPSTERWTEHLRTNVTGQNVELIRQAIVIGTKHFSYSSYNGRRAWTSDSIYPIHPATLCAKMARGEDGLFAFHEWLTGMYFIERQGVRKTPGGNCREWKITKAGGGPTATDYVCLGVKDHLPMFLHGTPFTSQVRFFDWNVPIEIQPPNLPPVAQKTSR